MCDIGVLTELISLHFNDSSSIKLLNQLVSLHINQSNTTSAPAEPAVSEVPPWVAPPLDAWKHHRTKLTTLFWYYCVCFVVGQCVNWLCLLNINKTKLTQSARFLMMTQCMFNTSYITVNFPYKAAILYLQRTFLPKPLKIFCGWLHIFVVFSSMFLQKAKVWFNSRKKSLIPPMIPVLFGCLYAFPSLNPCCYRFYKFTSYAMSYVGTDKQIQLKFSITASAILVFTLTFCYAWVFIKIRSTSRAVHAERDGAKREKKEIRLTLLFAITGGIWFVYLTMFYTIYWSGLFTAYSVLLLANEMLEQFLFFVDPVVYIILSSELRLPLMKLIKGGETKERRSDAYNLTATGKTFSTQCAASRRASSIPHPQLAFKRRAMSMPQALESQIDGDSTLE